jgi:hypothetical protein
MAFTIDHVFVMCSAGAPEAGALVRAGLVEGSANTHPGQGTANRRFFFDNMYLELLFVSDAEEAQREPVSRTRLWDRWSRRAAGACPFDYVMTLAFDGAAHSRTSDLRPELPLVLAW